MKKGMLFSVIVLLALQLVTTAYASELTDDYFDIANNYYNSNNYAKALEYLDLIMTIEPSNLEAQALKNKIAPPELTSEPIIEPSNPEVKKAIEKIMPSEDSIKVEEPKPIEIKPKKLKKKTKAAEPKMALIVDSPQENVEQVTYDSNYYNTKGQEFYQKQDFNMAIEYFSKAINLNHRNTQAYNNLAMTYWCKNDTVSAIKYFKKANFINWNYTQPLVNLSNVYKQLGDEKRQLYYLCKAIKYNKNDYLAYYWLGDYYRSVGEYPEAIESYKEVVKINPKYAQAYLSLAISFFETEEFGYCLIAINQYKELVPDSDFAYYLTARADLAISRYDDAKNDIEKAIQIKDNKEYQFELAKIYYYLQDYKIALDIFQNILQYGDNAEYFNYVGLCNYKLRNLEIAIVNFQKAIDLDGLRPIYYYNLAQCYKSVGDKKNYVKYVNSATKIMPINYQDFIDLSYIYFDNGNPSYAINSLNDAIKRYPSVKSLYLSKLKIYEAIGDNLHYNETKDLIEMRFNKK